MILVVHCAIILHVIPSFYTASTPPPSTPSWRIQVRFSYLLNSLLISVLLCPWSDCPLSGFGNCFGQEKKQEKKAEEGGSRPSAEQTKKRQGSKPIEAAAAFLKLLSDEERAKAALEYQSEARVGWHFIPMESRKGLPLMEMTQPQQKAAKALLRSAVSQLGFDKATTIMRLEAILLKLEGEASIGKRNPEKYYFTVFGTPASQQVWGLSVEGHHLSLNFSFKGNAIVDSTPQFMGANPAELNGSFGEKFPKGTRVLRDEEELGFELVTSLDEKQLATATLPGEVPEEIRGAGEAQPATDAPRGIAASQLNASQQANLKKLIEAYATKMKPGVVKKRWALIDQAGFDKVHFAWSGAMKTGQGHYYIVQGPTFVIEFINVQADAEGNPANHIHCVWRDLQGDFNLPIATK